MDRKEYAVRPFEPRDYGAVARLSAEVNPKLQATAEEIEHWDEMYRAPHMVDEKWMVEDRHTNVVVAYAQMTHNAYTYHPQKLWVNVIVTKDYRGRGIGRVLTDLLESEAAAHRVSHFWTSVRSDDARSLEFARRQGFVEKRRVWTSTLDLSSAPVPARNERADLLEREGVTFTTLSAEGAADEEVRRRIHDLVMDASRDVPRAGEFTPVSYEQFVGEWESPSFLPDGFFLARYGDAYVAMSNVERDLTQPDTMRVGFTCTRVPYRGRGIATELKRRTIEFVRSRGVRYFRTVNDSLNKPMWGINEKAGFRVSLEWVIHERVFPEVAAPGAR